jgi:hypothetical protein
MPKKEKPEAPETPKQPGLPSNSEPSTPPAAVPPAPIMPAVPVAPAPVKPVKPAAKVSAPIKHTDGTNHIVAECPFCASRDTELAEQLTAVDQRRRCVGCNKVFKLHVPLQK